MAAPGPAIRRGMLGMQKRKGVEPRYFVLYGDRLDYFRDGEDASSGGAPRGHLALDEVVSLEAADTSLVLHLRGQRMVLQQLPSEALGPWVADLRCLLEPGPAAVEEGPRVPPTQAEGAGEGCGDGEQEPVLCRGAMRVQRKGRAVERYFVLLPTRLDYYSEASDLQLGKDVRGCIHARDVVQIEDVPGGLSLHLESHQDPIGLYVDSPAERSTWLPALRGWARQAADADDAAAPEPSAERARAGGGASRGSILPGPSRPKSRGSFITEPADEPAGAPPAEARPQAVPEGPAEVPRGGGSAAAAPPEAAEARLCRGDFVVQRDGETNMEHVALYEGRLAFFGAQAELERGERPRLEVPMSDVMDVEVLDTGFDIVARGAGGINLYGCSGTDLQEWTDRLTGILNGRSPSPSEGEQRRLAAPAPAPAPAPGAWSAASWRSANPEGNADGDSRPGTPHFESAESWPAPAAAPEEAAAPAARRLPWASPPGGAREPGDCQAAPARGRLAEAAAAPASASSTPRSRAAPRRSLTPTGIPRPSGRRSASGTPRRASSATPRDCVLHEGPLLLLVDGREQERHFRLYSGRFEYFPDAMSAARGTGRCGRVPSAEVEQVRVQDDGFEITLARETLRLRLPHGVDMNTWAPALRRALVPDGSAHADGPDRRAEEPSAAAVAGYLAALAEAPVVKGPLGFLHWQSGSLATMYSLLFRDKLDCWDCAGSMVRGLQPQVRLMLSDVHSLETLLTGFVLNCRGKRIEVHVNNHRELSPWVEGIASSLASCREPEQQARTPTRTAEGGQVQRPRTPTRARQRSASCSSQRLGGGAAPSSSPQRSLTPQRARLSCGGPR